MSAFLGRAHERRAKLVALDFGTSLTGMQRLGRVKVPVKRGQQQQFVEYA